MKLFVALYKDGVKKVVHQIDAAAWKAEGWSEENLPELNSKLESKKKPPLSLKREKTTEASNTPKKEGTKVE